MQLDIIFDPMVIIGLFLSISLSLSFILEKRGVPHIIVYLLVGFVMANTIFNSINFFDEYEEVYVVVENLALGLIGFKIGTELKIKEIMKDRKALTFLLIGEAGGAFIAVFLLVSTFTGDFLLALILGGIATATAPAATVEVLRKLKAKGELTTRVQWVLAIDDVIAVVFIEAILVLLVVFLGGAFSLSGFFFGLLNELGVALLMGLVIGLILDTIVERMHDDLEMMELTLGVLILVIGIAHFIHTSVIFTCMVIGATVTNIKGDNYEKAGDLLEIIMSPIITIFFVLVGARIKFADFSPFPILAIIYLIARSIGKVGGSFAGGKAANLDPVITNNIGFGLLAQGGVALGLVSLINEVLIEHGEAEMGNLIITSIIISTIFSEMVGTLGARYSVLRAGESNLEDKKDGKNEDHLRQIHSRD